jgi:hypothetical protein
MVVDQIDALISRALAGQEFALRALLAVAFCMCVICSAIERQHQRKFSQKHRE